MTSGYLNCNSKLILMGEQNGQILAGENEIAPYSLRAAKFAVLFRTKSGEKPKYRKEERVERKGDG